MELTIAEIEERMLPGSFSEKGFLGIGEHLEEVIKKDTQTLELLGIGYSNLADALEAIIKAGEARPGWSIRYQHFSIKAIIYPGFQICPWADSSGNKQCTSGGVMRHASVDWTIKNHKNGMEMSGPGMIVHLIREHHFFEGEQSPYRIDPLKLAQLLDLIKVEPQQFNIRSFLKKIKNYFS